MSELDRWETRFSVPEYIFGTEPNTFLRAQRHRLPAEGSALAVADGEGRNGVWLAEQGLEVLSVDFSPRALVKAQALAKSRAVSLRTECLDVTRWSWPAAAFDVVAAIFIQFVGPDERKRILPASGGP
jgi:2-polyprenyl-3-methyl-5-hydroxy-6-metoxy-1,4-benzoquinol methylase